MNIHTNMRILRKELVKLFDLRLCLILSVFSVIFGYLFLVWNYYPGYGANSPYDIPMYESLIEKYGSSLSETEYAELLHDREELIDIVEHEIAEDELFRTYGLTTYQEFYEIHQKFSDEMTEEEKILDRETNQFYFHNEKTMPILFQIQVIDDIEQHIAIGKVYSNNQKLQNLREYLSDYTPMARERLIQYYNQKEMSLLPQSVYTFINDEMFRLIILSVICSFVLILFSRITENLRGIVQITVSSQVGRGIFRKQMWACVLCGGLVGLFISIIYGILLEIKNVYLFANCPISHPMAHFWIDMTFGQYLLLCAGLLIFISAVSGALAYCIGRLSSNYIAGIALSIPLAILYCFCTNKLTYFMLRIDIHEKYFQCRSFLSSLLWTFGGLGILTGLIFMVICILLKRDKERDIL